MKEDVGTEGDVMMAKGERLRAVTFPDGRLVIRLSPARLDGAQFGPHPGSVTCGLHTVQCFIIPDGLVPASQVYLSTGLMGRLHMEEMAAPIYASQQQREIRIGPVIGILCNPHWNARAGTLIASTQLPALEKLLNAAHDLGATAYLFRVEDVDFHHLRVQAYFKTAHGWRAVRVPLPDAIYDQLISRKRERAEEHMKLRSRLSRLYGVRIFNDGFFDKWQVHGWLEKDKRASLHLPRTIRYTHSQEASQFVHRHATVYLKPTHGSLGLGIVKIAHQSDGSYLYEIKRPNQSPISGRSNSSHDLVQSFRKRLSGRPYVLQEGIPLATIDGRPFDIRILMQRDGSGEWKRTKAFARVTKFGDITSNLSSGGEAMPMGAVLDQILAGNSRRKAWKSVV